MSKKPVAVATERDTAAEFTANQMLEAFGTLQSFHDHVVDKGLVRIRPDMGRGAMIHDQANAVAEILGSVPRWWILWLRVRASVRSFFCVQRLATLQCLW